MQTELNIDAERAKFLTAYRHWANEEHPNAHPEMVQFQAESHWGRAAGAMWLAARRQAVARDVGEQQPKGQYDTMDHAQLQALGQQQRKP